LDGDVLVDTWHGFGGDAAGAAALFAAAFAFGIGSAILPVILNAEIYVISMGALVPAPQLLFVLLCLGAGTVVGKAIVFEGVRRGSTRLKAERPALRREPRIRLTKALRRGGNHTLTLLSHRYLGSATVLLSSATGVPPLAVVTVLAAASRQPLWLFLVMVGVGRTSQFMALAFIVHQVAQ
jgi:membrane protein YqaA with SNARE-associated domain